MFRVEFVALALPPLCSWPTTSWSCLSLRAPSVPVPVGASAGWQATPAIITAITSSTTASAASAAAAAAAAAAATTRCDPGRYCERRGRRHRQEQAGKGQDEGEGGLHHREREEI
jgi:hypothetical protein